MRAATQPLVQSSTQIATAGEKMAATVESSAKALDEGQQAARELARTIGAQVMLLTQTWESYRERFGKVDEDLGRALEALSKETEKQLQILGKYTVDTDGALSKAVSTLSSFVANIAESAEDLADAAGELNKTLARPSAPERRP